MFATTCVLVCMSVWASVRVNMCVRTVENAAVDSNEHDIQLHQPLVPISTSPTNPTHDHANVHTDANTDTDTDMQ